MSNGRTYGRFSPRSDRSIASRVMGRAQKMGATKRMYEEFQRQQEKLQEEAERVKKGSILGGLGSTIGSIFGGKVVAPWVGKALAGAFGLATGGLGNLALLALGTGGATHFSKSIGESLARQLSGTRDKKFRGVVDFNKNIGGMYSGVQDKLTRSLSDKQSELQAATSEAQRSADATSLLMSTLSGIGTAGKTMDAFSKTGSIMPEGLDKFAEFGTTGEGSSQALIDSLKDIGVKDIQGADFQQGVKSAWDVSKGNIGSSSYKRMFDRLIEDIFKNNESNILNVEPYIERKSDFNIHDVLNKRY